MSPVHAAAARNTNIAAEGKVLMTDEELEQQMQELDEGIKELSDREKTLTKEEERRKHILTLKKEVLQKIKEARAKKNVTQELNYTVTYGLLNTYGEKHPYFMHFLQSKFRMNIF